RGTTRATRPVGAAGTDWICTPGFGASGTTPCSAAAGAAMSNPNPTITRVLVARMPPLYQSHARQSAARLRTSASVSSASTARSISPMRAGASARPALSRNLSTIAAAGNGRDTLPRPSGARASRTRPSLSRRSKRVLVAQVERTVQIGVVVVAARVGLEADRQGLPLVPERRERTHVGLGAEERAIEAEAPVEDRRRPREAAARQGAGDRSRVARPAGVHTLDPGAVFQVLEHPGREAAGDAERRRQAIGVEALQTA